MNAAEAQLEVASHLAEANKQLERAVLACGDFIFIWPANCEDWPRLCGSDERLLSNRTGFKHRKGAALSR